MKTILHLALLLVATLSLSGCVASATYVDDDYPRYYHRPHSEVYVYGTRPVHYNRTVIYKNKDGHHGSHRGHGKHHSSGHHRR